MLLEPLAPDRDVGHAGHAQQPRPDLPVGRHRQVHQADGLRRQADLHDPARRRERLHHERRRRPRRQRRRDRAEPLLDELARLEEVGAALEEQRDVRELRRPTPSGSRRRPATPFSASSSGTVTSSSTSAADSPRQAVWISTRVRRELREDVDLLVAELAPAEEDERGGGRHDQEAEPQARCRRSSARALRVALSPPRRRTRRPAAPAAPTVTTGVPAGGPLLSSATGPLVRATVIGVRT